VRLDTTNLWRQKPKPQIALHNAVFNLKQAIKADADAVVVYLFIGGELERKSFSLVSDIINKAHDYDLPVIVEPMIEKGIGESIAEPTELINAARLAVEMGADILKVDYTGDQESFKELVKTSSVPVLLRGGPKRESQSLIDEMVKDAIKAGARGVVFGRNVWQTENVTERVKHLISLVHEKF
jgi:DhnA-type fructose-1,6-bisphosphate aldolase and related enzymes